jgi:hypothetical protein
MVLLSKPESHLAPKRRNDDESDAVTYALAKLWQNNQSLPDISHAILRSVMRFASLLRDIEGKVLNPPATECKLETQNCRRAFLRVS